MSGEETWHSLAERELRARRRTIRNLIVMLFATALLFMTVAVAIDVEYLSEGLGLIYGLLWFGFALDAWRSHRVSSAAYQRKTSELRQTPFPLMTRASSNTPKIELKKLLRMSTY